MADNVAQSIKDLQKDLAALDKQLLSNNANWNKLGQTIVDSMKRGGLGIDDLFSQMKSQKDVLKLRAIIDRDALMDDVKKLQTVVDKGFKSVKVGGVEITGQRQIEQALEGYKAQLKLVPKTLAEAYDYAVKIANTLGGGNSSKASKEWLERTALTTKEKKALDDATNGYIKQTQAIQDLNRTLDELKQKRATAEAIPVTGVGKSGISYKTDASKQSALGKIDKEIEATETKINNATTAAQKFQAQLIAMQGEKKTKAMSRALGVEEAEAEVQKIPTVFDRVIAQINQRAAQSKDKFAKQLVNAEGLRNEAKNAAAEVSNELNYIWRGSQSHLLAAWRSNTGYLTDFGRQDAVNQIRLSQEYKSNLDALKTQEVRDKLTQALTRYKDALQAVITLEEQQRRSAAQYSAQERAVEGVTRRFNENEQAIARVRDRWDELNVKRQAGLVNEKDFKANSQKLLDEYDRLIAKRKEFETTDIGQSLSERLRKQQEEEKRLEADRVRSAKETSKIITEERGKQALSSLIGSPKMNAAVQQQLKYMQQIRSIGKDINALQSNKNRSAEENALLEKRKKELRDVLELQKRLNNEQKGSANLARQIDKYNQLRGKVKETTDEVKRQKTSLESMLPTLRRLASAFGVAFSVQGLVNFGRKLVETRGEFEMQFVAMKQIIGDVDAATKIWNQTMQQALQSPFKAMQLVDYTKKLAAYRIETDKLFDTTKRLADVSAGLGVDMGRLILAYGQVKAANFLRASEIRQFTEAGVNIVGQLSEYFTQLEGRAVSTADVMERVTKRMVLFEDVEEIFKRMTDEGGTFYNMQEVQAETVRGQIMKLHDAYDQMLNTIGQANQGTIRNLIESANSLVRNWRDVASFLMKNVNAFVILLPLIATYRKGAKLAANETFTWTRAMRQIGLELTFARNGMKKFSISTAAGTAAVYMFKGAMEILKTTFRTFLPFLAIEGLILLVTKMQAADRAAKQLTKDLDEVGKRNAQSLQDNIDGFTNLVERLKRATEGSQDYLDIRNKIQNQYGEYLDNLEAEQITVENLANSYDRVVERMREKSRQHIMEEGIQEIEKTYSDAYLKFTKALEGTKVGNIKLSSGEAEDIAKKMYDLYSKNPSRYDTNKLFLAALTQYGLSGVADGTTFSERNEFFKSIEQRYKKQLELETKANSLTRATANTHQEYLDQLALEEKHQENINKIQQKVQSKEKTEYELQLEKIRYDEKRLELQAKYEKKSSEWLDKEKKKLKENYDAFLTSYNARVEAYIGSVYGTNWREVDNEKAFKDYNAIIATQSRIAQGQSRWEESILNDKKVTEENIKRLKEEQATQTAKDAEASKHLNDELTKENHRLELIKKQMELLGLHEKDKSKGGGSANNSIYGDRIRLLQDMLQKYRQAAKEAYGFAKAEEKTGQSFEDAWNSIMPAGYGGLEVPTSYAALAEMLQRLEAFTPQFDKNGQLSKMMADLKKAIADALSNVDLEMSVRIREDFGRQMEEAFGNYELTLDLQKLNLPSDVLSDLFDLETVDLSDLRRRVTTFYNELAQEGDVDREDMKSIEGYIKKIDGMERKQQQERIKDYAKFLEYELSERAKISMEYARKIAQVQIEKFSDDEAENLRRRQKIIEGLNKEKDEKLAKQDWEDFKSMDVYVQMMEDLEKHGTVALRTMREELEKIRKNAENLSPRALKEVVSAIEKIREIELNRSDPFRGLSEAREDVKNALKVAGVSSKAELYAEADAAEKALVSVQQEKREVDEIVAAKKKEKELTEDIAKLAKKDVIKDVLSNDEIKDKMVALTSLMNEKEREANDIRKERENLEKEILKLSREQSRLIDEQGKEDTSAARKEEIKTRLGEIGNRLNEINGLINTKEVGENIARGIFNEIYRYIQAKGELSGLSPELLSDNRGENEQQELSEREKRLQEIQNKYQAAINDIDTYNKQVARLMVFIDTWTGKVQELWSSISELSSAYEGEFGDWVSRWGSVVDTTFQQVSKLSKAFADFQAVRADYLKSATKKAADKASSAVDNMEKASETAQTQANTAATQANTVAKIENANASNLAAMGNSAVGTSAAAATPAVITFGATLLMAMGWVGLIMAALEALFAIIKAIAGAHDSQLDKQIEYQQKKIDALKDAYARLERQIERTWNSVSYMQTYEQQVQNIREQIDAMEAQMRAEEAKKNTDDNAVRQYQRDIQDAYDQLDELEQKSIEVFGGIGEEGYISAAQGFVEAWKSAFLETGDGLQGLQDHFDEFLQDWFVKQATMRIAGGMLEPVFRQIDAAVDKYGEGGTSAMLSEIERVRDMAAAIFPDLSLALEDLAGMFGVGGEGSLSGLAAGIQGMTEEQANILEAYWNSVRMYTASIDVNVARIASVITSGGVGKNFVGGRPSEIEVGVSMGDMKTSINRLATTLLDNNESTNPMLQQLTIIAHTTNSINTLLQSVVRSGHSLGGYGLKVFPN